MTHVAPSGLAAVQSGLPPLPLDLSPLFADGAAVLPSQSSLLLSPLLSSSSSSSPTFLDSMFASPVMPLNDTFAAIDTLHNTAQLYNTYTKTSPNTLSDASSTSQSSTAVIHSRSSSPALPPPPPPPKSKPASQLALPSQAKSAKVLSPIEKAAERRRKNRESSSRCYYNRKRIIQNLEKQLLSEKQKLTDLYDRALQLRHDNARLKKEVVTNGYALPCSRTSRAYNNSNAFSLREYLRLLHHSTYHSASQGSM